MLQRKYSIKIEIAADRKFFDLEGVSTEDALKLIEAASAIRVSHSEDIEISDTDCPLPVPLNKTEGLPQHVTLLMPSVHFAFSQLVSLAVDFGSLEFVKQPPDDELGSMDCLIR